MAAFTVFWLTGHKEVIHGRDIADAFNKQYSPGALQAIDFYAPSSEADDLWEWDKKKHTWVKTGD